MPLPFLDRAPERRRLRRQIGRRGGSFTCLYGRRRCGKSRLLAEALPLQRTVAFVADEREPALQMEALAIAVDRQVPGAARVRYPDWAALLERWFRESPPGSILVLDELPYLAARSPELPSVLQRLVDDARARESRRHLVVCGSSQRMMQGLVLDASAPLYGRAEEILRIDPLAPSWIGPALGLDEPAAMLEAYAVWGGVPRYWELAREHRGLWDAVTHLVLDPLGALHAEPYRLLLDDLRDTTQAVSILFLVGAGCHRLSEIAARLQKPATALSRPIARLVELGYLRRDVPFGEPERSGKRSLYRLADPFLAFSLRFAPRHGPGLGPGPDPDIVRRARAGFSHHVGTVWEELARSAVSRMTIAGLRFGPAQRWWGAGTDRQPLEIDVVARSSDGDVVLVGEASLAEDVAAVERELASKAARLPLPRHGRVLPVAFVARRPRRRGKGGATVSASDVLDALT